MRILVVDDESDVCEFLAAALRQYGAHVETATSVAKALEAIERARPHLIFSDIAMPGQDGYDLIRALKNLERDRGVTIPAVAVTGCGRAGDHTEALKSGFHWYIGKPVEPAELATVVADVLGKHGHQPGG